MMSAALRSREAGVATLILLTVIVVGCINPAFFSLQNVRDILIAAAPGMIVACGLTLVVVLGEIDISMGALMGVCAAVLGKLVSGDHAALPVWAAMLIVITLGAGVGLINGLLVTVARVPSIIATLGMLTALTGVGDLVMAGETIGNFPQALRSWAIGSLGPIPVPVLVALLCIAGFTVLTRAMPLGRRIYAVGSNPHAARLAGLPVARIKLLAFVLTGALTGVATLISAPQLDVIEAGFGRQFELLAVTAVVVGGTSISGGVGTIIGSGLGVLLLSLVRTVLIFLQLGISATYWERAIQGGFILAAVLADHLGRKRGSHP
ncbi:MAG TPA: ABC transporter permease [Planctomycetota bacterium]|nr:ABC transporter permease [Planctomycetota bacterium]